jgi:hypothetical protein
MPELRELEARLAILRRQIDEAKRAGSTASQIRTLQTECWQLWAAVERCKQEHLFALLAGRRLQTPTAGR